MIKILVADDHPIFRSGIKQIVECTEDIRVIDEAETGQETISKVQKSEFDVILMDINMPGIGGLEALKQIRQFKPKLPVLIVSFYEEEQYAIRAIQAGAVGYIQKICAPDEIISAIRKVHQGGKYITESLAEELVAAVYTKTTNNDHQQLSNREYQTMCLLAQGRSIKQISEQLNLSPSTVATFRKRILTKMNMKSNSEIVRYAIQNNLLE
jgi:two-component system, NarL family, invasion response regulator UvrY